MTVQRNIRFNYYRGFEGDMHSYYRIPKVLFTHKYFENLSCEAKVLYGLMLDRMSLSIQNHWFDEENQAYIFFSIEDIMKMMRCGKGKAVDMMKALSEIGLIEKKRLGFGKANIIYVKNFSLEEYPDEIIPLKEENDELVTGESDNIKKFENRTIIILKRIILN